MAHENPQSPASLLSTTRERGTVCVRAHAVKHNGLPMSESTADTRGFVSPLNELEWKSNPCCSFVSE